MMCAHRPRARATARPRAWWLYGGRLAQERARTSRRAARYDPWLEMWHLYSTEAAFVELELRARAHAERAVWAATVEPLGAEERVRKAEMERTLSLNVILKLRARADARMELASERCDAQILPMMQRQRGRAVAAVADAASATSATAAAAAHATASAFGTLPYKLHAPLSALFARHDRSGAHVGKAAEKAENDGSGKGGAGGLKSSGLSGSARQPQIGAHHLAASTSSLDSGAMDGLSDDDNDDDERAGDGGGGGGGGAARVRRTQHQRRRERRLRPLAALPYEFWRSHAVCAILQPTRHSPTQNISIIIVVITIIVIFVIIYFIVITLMPVRLLAASRGT
ncbi:hypothetical protein T492DRAFT_78552 [Pavlovales sp. CCMP2436]|nr:hypothetical protein T492DRAFT_78552 [Pavlovales sp. CCMP2436]